MKLREVIRDLEEIAPPGLVDEGDKIGLQVGNVESDATRVLVAVDPTPAVVDAAVHEGADLLICHHPLIYTPLESLAAGEPTQDRLIKLISAGVALYVMHTNYDSVEGGVNDALAETLGVDVTGILATRRRERKFKVIVFVPSESVDAVRDAMAEAGAGIIGHYTYCSFRTEGIGTFVAMPTAQPYVGDIGNLEEVGEFRLEMLVPEWRLGQVIDAMIAKHPYEEVAYDVYPLANEPYTYGYGRVGRLKNAVKLAEFRETVAEALDFRETRMIGDADRPVEIVALCGGAGRSLIKDAAACGANVFVTGDMGHHDMLAADALGLAVIDAGHYHTERPGMEALAERLSRIYAEKPVSVEFLP
ncbi:MAG: Nif3-like dinuclear metal center hexameric protein [Armatimonadetes bacterium]|nr:Nif3-like dinuclear metal center hexameric protein [Armatimonadota bacterium]